MELCKKAAMQRGLKDLSFCKQIPVPGYYGGRKYGLRKAKNYKGKPHDSHVRVFKSKKPPSHKCKCYVCGEEGHYARQCTRKRKDVARAAVVQDLDIPENWDVVSVDLNEPDSDSICSVTEGEIGRPNQSNKSPLEDLPYEHVLMADVEEIRDYGWRVRPNLPPAQKECSHEFQINEPIDDANHLKCVYCHIQTNVRMRIHCRNCKLTACLMCARPYHDERHQPAKPKETVQGTNKDILIRELVNLVEDLMRENERLKEQLEELQIRESPRTKRDRGKNHVQYDSDGIEIAYEESAHVAIASALTGALEEAPKRKVINGLYNFPVEFQITGAPHFTIKAAILDTGATRCCIDPAHVPKEAIEQSKWPVMINGLNSVSRADQKLKDGHLSINGIKYRIPFTYCFGLGTRDGIQMLIGCNFIRAISGGVRIEGDVVTFYKNIGSIHTSIESSQVTYAIPELELEEEEYLLIREAVYYSFGETTSRFKSRFTPVLNRLEAQGYIGPNPQEHWSKNQIVCKLDIINPDITIQDKPLKHVTLEMAA